MARIPKGRPEPEEVLHDEDPAGHFIPAPELGLWLRKHFIEEGGALYRPEHKHLQTASIGCLWTNVPLRTKGQDVAATASMPSVQGNQWVRGQYNQLLRQWFGIEPVFLLTFYAPENVLRSDVEFCALCRHELLHCGQKLDMFGCPAFTKDGLPQFALRGHDVEEFVAVAEDFGIAACAGQSRAFVAAAKNAPKVGEARISAACGNCLR